MCQVFVQRRFEIINVLSYLKELIKPLSYSLPTHFKDNYELKIQLDKV